MSKDKGYDLVAETKVEIARGGKTGGEGRQKMAVIKTNDNESTHSLFILTAHTPGGAQSY